MDNFTHIVKKMGIKSIKSSQNRIRRQEVTNTISTRNKSYKHSVEGANTTKKKCEGGQHADMKANKKYTQVIRERYAVTKTRIQRFHISTPPNNTSSLFNINILKLTKTKCELNKPLLKYQPISNCISVKGTLEYAYVGNTV
jgi:hypothetical protein